MKRDHSLRVTWPRGQPHRPARSRSLRALLGGQHMLRQAQEVGPPLQLALGCCPSRLSGKGVIREGTDRAASLFLRALHPSAPQA